MNYTLKITNHNSITIITKRTTKKSNTNYTQKNITTIITNKDNFDNHIENTIITNNKLNKHSIISLYIQKNPKTIHHLQNYNIEFETNLKHKNNHTQQHVLHTKNITNHTIQQTLINKISNHPNITLFPHHTKLNLIHQQKLIQDKQPNQILNTYILNKSTKQVQTFKTKMTYLTTNNTNKVYLYTSNPNMATKNKITITYHTQTKITNIKFFQFHPTYLYHPHTKSFLINKTLHKKNKILHHMDNKPFINHIHPINNLTPHNIITHTIDVKLKHTKNNSILLNLTTLDTIFLKKQFPTILNQYHKLNIDFRTNPIPIVPTTHYQYNNIVTNQDKQTSVPNLFTINKITYTKLHNTNRLTSNSLLECTMITQQTALTNHLKINITAQSINLPHWSPNYTEPNNETIIINHN